MKRIKDLITAKFKEGKAKATLENKCPHCGRPLFFKFEHTQNSKVDTTLVEIAKEDKEDNA